MENNLQKVRWEKDLTQGQLSRMSGVPQSVISAIENYNTEPRVSTAIKLAKALSTDVDALFIPRK